MLSKENRPYRVKESIWDTGERFAFTEGPDGLGSYWPILYAVTRLRSSGRSIGTMMGKARAIALFHTWAASREIDVMERLQGALSRYHLTQPDTESRKTLQHQLVHTHSWQLFRR